MMTEMERHFTTHGSARHRPSGVLDGDRDQPSFFPCFRSCAVRPTRLIRGHLMFRFPSPPSGVRCTGWRCIKTMMMTWKHHFTTHGSTRVRLIRGHLVFRLPNTVCSQLGGPAGPPHFGVVPGGKLVPDQVSHYFIFQTAPLRPRSTLWTLKAREDHDPVDPTAAGADCRSLLQ